MRRDLAQADPRLAPDPLENLPEGQPIPRGRRGETLYRA
jgi:hypothetical protein